MRNMRCRDNSASDLLLMEKYLIRESLQLNKTIPLVKLKIHDADGDHYFIWSNTSIHPPQWQGVPAFDVSQAKMFFLKDSWRMGLPDIQSECETYKMLRDAGVRNISSLPCIRRYLVRWVPCYKDPKLCHGVIGLFPSYVCYSPLTLLYLLGSYRACPCWTILYMSVTTKGLLDLQRFNQIATIGMWKIWRSHFVKNVRAPWCARSLEAVWMWGGPN